MGLVTIKTYTYPHETAVVRSLLEPEGIKTYSQDSIIIQVDPFYSNAVGGVKLQVAEEDSQRALEIMQEKGFIEAPNTQEQLQLDEKIRALLRARRNSTYRFIIIFIVFIAFFIYSVL